LKQNVERLSVEKKEFDAFDQRLSALHSGVAAAEGRMDGLLAKDEIVSALTRRIDDIHGHFQGLDAYADELLRKQTTLESLGGQLEHVDAAWQAGVDAAGAAAPEPRRPRRASRGDPGRSPLHAEAAGPARRHRARSRGARGVRRPRDQHARPRP
jgi:hypothetical protein